MTHYGTATAALPDPSTVREQLFLLAHDEDRNLRPWIHVPALEVGLAGAALIDLVIAPGHQFVAAHSNRYNGWTPQVVPADPGTEHVVQHLTGLLPAVLRELGPGLYDTTSSALAARGYIRRNRQWGRDRYHLADVSPLVRIRAKVRHHITATQPQPNVETEALCALISALNMGECLIFGVSRTDIAGLLQQLTTRPSSPADPRPTIAHVARAVRNAIDHLALSAM
jgi:hypothetical protein